jgi:hypothetical protein
MNENFDSIEFLVQETFNLADQGTDFKNPFDNNKKDELSQFLDSLSPRNQSGIMYRVNQASYTFSIKSLCFKDLKTDIKKILDNKEFNCLFNNSQEITSQEFMSLINREVFIYYTNHISLAEIIYENINNRRFPLKEDNIFNISDPSLGWWFLDKGDEFEISFRTPLRNSNQIHNLGPIGDHFIFFSLLKQWKATLEEDFNLSARLQSSSKILFKKVGNSLLFDQLKNLLIIGKDASLTLSSRQGEKFEEFNQSFLLFIHEVSHVRSFWKIILDKVGKDKKNLLN